MEIGLIFDMDGVIIDSNPFHKNAWRNFLLNKGIPYSDEIFDNVISGRNGPTNIRSLMGQDLPEKIVCEYVAEIDGGFRELLRNTEDICPIPGLYEFLDAIQNSGFKTALATSAPPGNVDLVLERLDLRGYFDMILDSTDVTNGKPDPEIYLTAVKRLGVEKNLCIVFEDSRAGIESARNAGLLVIGVSTSHNRKELLEEGVSMVIDDFKNLTLHEVSNLLQ